MNSRAFSLLTAGEPPAVAIEESDGRSPFLLVCEHASHALPRSLGNLGLDETERQRHIAWDIGAAGVARRLSRALHATLLLQNYSRLVVDCNRAPNHPDIIPVLSELTEIPGNRNLRLDEISARIEEIYWPFQKCVARELDARRDAGRLAVLVAVHSFTPIFKGVARPWHVGLLYNRDDRLGRGLFDVMQHDPDLVIGINEPYAISDKTDYTIPVHGERRGIPHIEFEIRQDLIESPDGQRDWAARLAHWLKDGCKTLSE